MESENEVKIGNADLFISKEYYHHHAFEILKSNPNIKKFFFDSLNSEIPIVKREKITRKIISRAIEAKALNIAVRDLLNRESAQDIKFEVFEDKGVFYFSTDKKSSIGGFDFAIINHSRNLTALRNICFGELQYNDGINRWKKFLEKNLELNRIAEEILQLEEVGKDIDYIKPVDETPLILGEIQFGNWALAYRDFFKVLKANVQNSVDCLVYIVPTENLEKMLSDGIVTFDKTKEILISFEKVISVPIWLIGLDLRTE